MALNSPLFSYLAGRSSRSRQVILTIEAEITAIRAIKDLTLVINLR